MVEGGDGITAEGTRGTKAQRQDTRGGDQREGGRRCEDEKARTAEPRVPALAQDLRCSKGLLTMLPATPECRKCQGEHSPAARLPQELGAHPPAIQNAGTSGESTTVGIGGRATPEDVPGKRVAEEMVWEKPLSTKRESFKAKTPNNGQQRFCALRVRLRGRGLALGAGTPWQGAERFHLGREGS